MDVQVPAQLRYTKEHEWIREEGAVATIGVTDYAQTRLGDVVFVEMPEIATVFKKGETMGVVESVKAVSDVFAPVGGEVSEINTSLEEHPEYVNASPYKDGWIVKIKISKDSEFEDLMDNEGYQRYVQQEMENG